MMGLPDSESILMIRSAVLIQSTRVTERQTDGRTDGIAVATRYSVLSILLRVKRKEEENLKSRMQKKSSLNLYKNYKTNIKE